MGGAVEVAPTESGETESSGFPGDMDLKYENGKINDEHGSDIERLLADQLQRAEERRHEADERRKEAQRVVEDAESEIRRVQAALGAYRGTEGEAVSVSVAEAVRRVVAKSTGQVTVDEIVRVVRALGLEASRNVIVSTLARETKADPPTLVREARGVYRRAPALERV